MVKKEDWIKPVTDKYLREIAEEIQRDKCKIIIHKNTPSKLIMKITDEYGFVGILMGEYIELGTFLKKFTKNKKNFGETLRKLALGEHEKEPVNIFCYKGKTADFGGMGYDQVRLLAYYIGVPTPEGLKSIL